MPAEEASKVVSCSSGATALLGSISQEDHDDPGVEGRQRNRQNVHNDAPAGCSSSLAAVPADQLHTLLLLSDSALPLGSFAFSSGLESFLAHQPTTKRTAETFNSFLALSLASLGATSLAYVVAAFREPSQLALLDNEFDASTTCTVARRASVKQGRALVTLWERSFRSQATGSTSSQQHRPGDASWDESVAEANLAAIDGLCTGLKTSRDDAPFAPKGHLAPLFGALCSVLHVPLQHVLYIFLMNHAKALLSAAIRASVIGPYHSQTILAGEGLRARISKLVIAELQNPSQVARAGQSVPMLDIWGGRHEIVYSRIFNS